MPPPENFEKLSALRRNLVHFGCPNEADEQASQTQEMTTYLIKCSPFLLHHEILQQKYEYDLFDSSIT